ncbi:FecCD family ABC transporter permease [Saccharospirillum mangrovi]|uniref:FecCD family ABC transporter permease n=1 Tax=Saccharospirillum mangrovi TaxID=2161747 RepID=UPI000D33E72F|nr:iron ABC transporter permease [Saccharospirillum mangrovi]
MTARTLAWLLPPVLLLSALLALSVGPSSLELTQVWQALWHPGDGINAVIVWQIRLPRLMLALCVGALLGLSGALVQGLFRNPLAEPGLMGVSSGATLAVVASLILAPAALAALPAVLSTLALPAIAFVGGLIATQLVMLLGRDSLASPLRLILAGVAFNMVAAAGIGLCAYLSSNEQLRTLTFWSLGSFGAADWRSVSLTAAVLLVVSLLALRLYRPLNALLLGEPECRHLGFDVRRLKRQVVYLSAASVGAAVAFTGIIGFIGLVVPHMVRLLVGPDHRRVLPLSLGVGALLTLWADWLARTVISPAELPVGIITSLLGGPFFVYLIQRQRTVLS